MCEYNVIMSVKKEEMFSNLVAVVEKQCNSTRFTTGRLLNFLGFIKKYPACMPAACKKFKHSQLGCTEKA